MNFTQRSYENINRHCDAATCAQAAQGCYDALEKI